MRKHVLLVVGLMALGGCATQTFTIHGAAPELPTQQKMQAFFISGLGQTKEMDAAKICGGANKVAKVEAHLRFLDGFLGAITYGIYTPRTAKVYCVQ